MYVSLFVLCVAAFSLGVFQLRGRRFAVPVWGLLCTCCYVCMVRVCSDIITSVYLDCCVAAFIAAAVVMPRVLFARKSIKPVRVDGSLPRPNPPGAIDVLLGRLDALAKIDDLSSNCATGCNSPATFDDVSPIYTEDARAMICIRRCCPSEVSSFVTVSDTSSSCAGGAHAMICVGRRCSFEVSSFCDDSFVTVRDASSICATGCNSPAAFGDLSPISARVRCCSPVRDLPVFDAVPPSSAELVHGEYARSAMTAGLRSYDTLATRIVEWARMSLCERDNLPAKTIVVVPKNRVMPRKFWVRGLSVLTAPAKTLRPLDGLPGAAPVITAVQPEKAVTPAHVNVDENAAFAAATAIAFVFGSMSKAFDAVERVRSTFERVASECIVVAAYMTRAVYQTPCDVDPWDVLKEAVQLFYDDPTDEKTFAVMKKRVRVPPPPEMRKIAGETRKALVEGTCPSDCSVAFRL